MQVIRSPAAKHLNPDAPSEQQRHPSDGHPKTIGDALEEAAAKSPDKPLEMKHTRVIQSAEARATGAAAGVLGGPSSVASNLYGGAENPTLGQALKDAKSHLPADKVSTPRDSARIEQADQRNDPLGRVDPAGVAASVREAAEYNVERGYVSPSVSPTTTAGGTAEGIFPSVIPTTTAGGTSEGRSGYVSPSVSPTTATGGTAEGRSRGGGV